MMYCFIASAHRGSGPLLYAKVCFRQAFEFFLSDFFSGHFSILPLDKAVLCQDHIPVFREFCQQRLFIEGRLRVLHNDLLHHIQIAPSYHLLPRAESITFSPFIVLMLSLQVKKIIPMLTVLLANPKLSIP